MTAASNNSVAPAQAMAMGAAIPIYPRPEQVKPLLEFLIRQLGSTINHRRAAIRKRQQGFQKKDYILREVVRLNLRFPVPSLSHMRALEVHIKKQMYTTDLMSAEYNMAIAMRGHLLSTGDWRVAQGFLLHSRLRAWNLRLVQSGRWSGPAPGRSMVAARRPTVVVIKRTHMG